MGVSELMEEQTRYRRRTTNTQSQATSLIQVPSGEAEDDEGAVDKGSRSYHKTTKRKDNGQRKSRRRPRKASSEDPPFAVLFLQVGVTLFLFCWISHTIYRRIHPYDPHEGMIEELVYVVGDDTDPGSSNDDDGGAISEKDLPNSPEYTAEDEAKMAQLIKEREAQQAAEEAAAKAAETPPPLPTFDLSQAAKWDAFGFVEQGMGKESPETTTFWQAASGLRQRYTDYYGSENIARMLLDQGLTTFFMDQEEEEEGGGIPADIVSTACRFQAAKDAQRPFQVAFGGYSVTAGRGNKFEQSFPFQFQRILETVVKLAGIPGLTVRNAAIGGCPAFPYGWCMTNFWGDAPDVVSWDYSMNEAGGVPEGLEAYLRHMLTTYNNTDMPNPPKIIVKDTYLANHRRDLLGAYAHLLKDPVVIHTGPAIKPMMQIAEDAHRPLGFREWRKFGAPQGAPGQALHHPAVKEHELIGWMLAMHFLTALEHMMAHSKEAPLVCPLPTPTPPLPKPLSGNITGMEDATYDRLLFGHSSSNAANSTWEMNSVRCRTTFQPILDGDLSNLIVRGTVAEDLDVVLPKSQMYYNRGWTLDLSEDERTTKRKLSIYENGLGFIDSKEAYYGIYESPMMELFLPYETAAPTDHGPQVDQHAADWFESVVLCQVNEKRSSDACNLATDLGFMVGTANATDLAHLMKETGTLYLGNPVCTRLDIPSTATLTSHNTLSPESPLEKDKVGLLVGVKVTNSKIAHINQACSISHVIWEERRFEAS